MTIKRKAASGQKTCVTPISGKQTIESTESLFAKLQNLTRQKEGIVLDLSQVEECDVTALQLFCSAAATLKASGRELTVSSLSPAAVEALHAFGLQKEALFCAFVEPVEPSHVDSAHLASKGLQGA